MKHLPFTLFITFVILVLSLMPVPETPLSDVQFIDKWTHVAMYLGLSWAFCLDLYLLIRAARRENIEARLSHLILLTGALVYPIFLGGLTELLQAYCTNGMRSGEWLDWLADAVGALIGSLIGIIVLRRVADKA